MKIHGSSGVNFRQPKLTPPQGPCMFCVCFNMLLLIWVERHLQICPGANRSTLNCEFSFQLPVNVGVMEFLIRMNQFSCLSSI